MISLDESRALARRLLEPCWKAVAEKGDDPTKCRFLESLLPADPAGVLQKLEGVKFKDEGWRLRLSREIVLALAERDPEEAATVAESIADPATRSWALVRLSDQLPGPQRQRKLALLDRALQQARIAPEQGDRLNQMGEVAERWYELGMLEKAKTLFAEALKIATEFTDKTDFKRGMFAAKLALVDLSSAETIARDYKGDPSESRILGNMAFHLAAQKPADCERLWKHTATVRGPGVMSTVLCWKLATVDPARALRVVSAVEIHPSARARILCRPWSKGTRPIDLSPGRTNRTARARQAHGGTAGALWVGRRRFVVAGRTDRPRDGARGVLAPGRVPLTLRQPAR